MNTKEKTFKGVKLSGIGMLIFNLLFLCAIIYFFVWIDSQELAGNVTAILAVLNSVLFLINTMFWGGFILIEPNEAKVLLFFGKYVGTVKENGYFWVNPFYMKKKLTLRVRNLDADPIKVNDKAGNPVMIGQVVVWRIVDTYKASFDIDSKVTQTGNTSANLNEKMKAYEYFVKVQSDAALRNVAGMYAYDNTINDDGNLTLRSRSEDLNNILEKQLNERLDLAGIEVLEARINYLAYAPEIAAVMLRRQQADAIISAREKIVDGAVGMVKQALQKLSDEEIIELDDDKKAAMVTNLLVVLCSDEPAQPVINSGTLHK
jgi:regulator of protease activity HflC (stomatin/prohibitin superfamily)